MRRDDICVCLGPADRAQLQAQLTDRNTPPKVVWHAYIVLATAYSCDTDGIMRRADTPKPTVRRWQERYFGEGVARLGRHKARPSRVPPLPQETRQKVTTKTAHETPPNAAHWNRGLKTDAEGISSSSVKHIWADADLKPQLAHGFKVSNGPMFE